MARGNHNPVIAPRSPSPRIKKYVRLFFGLLWAVALKFMLNRLTNHPGSLAWSARLHGGLDETADVVDIRERVFRRAEPVLLR